MSDQTSPAFIPALERAIELIRHGWTQGSNARTAKGKTVGIDDSNAVQFCAWGALWRAEREMNVLQGSLIDHVRRHISTVPRPWRQITAWNDAPDRTKDDVLKVFNHVLEELKRS